MRIIGFLLASVFAVGCYATADGGVYGPNYSVTATTVAPDLVYVSPGVQVVYGHDEPVFYSDGFYWRESGGRWYRSSYHTGGWITYAPPRAVFGIRDRHTYRNYRPANYTPRSRSYRNDNRTYRNDNRPNQTRTNNRPDARPAPAVREAPKRDNRPDARKTSKDDDRKNRR